MRPHTGAALHLWAHPPECERAESSWQHPAVWEQDHVSVRRNCGLCQSSAGCTGSGSGSGSGSGCLASVCSQTQSPHQRELGSADVSPADSLGLQQCGEQTGSLWDPRCDSTQWNYIKEKIIIILLQNYFPHLFNSPVWNKLRLIHILYWPNLYILSINTLIMVSIHRKKLSHLIFRTVLIYIWEYT